MKKFCFLFLVSFAFLFNPKVCTASPASPKTSRGGEVVQWSKPSIGLNKFDLMMQYLGTASGGDGSPAFRRITKAMAKKAIKDAQNIGVTYFRVAIAGYAPSCHKCPGDLDLWMNSPQKHWQMIDEMVADLEHANMRLVPVFIWNHVQFPATTGEDLNYFIRNAWAKSRFLLEKYIGEFINRYKNKKVIYFYELTNELNLSADLDLIEHHKNIYGPEYMKPIGNFTTEEMIGFTKQTAIQIRNFDPTRPISSGFSLPRYNAEHARKNPKKINWQIKDSLADLKRNIADIHSCCDIISIHFYNGPQDSGRFGLNSQTAVMLNVIKKITDDLGKPLFVGEFGDSDPQDYRLGSPFTEKILDKIVELKIPNSAPWAWEFYQFDPNVAYVKGGVSNIEPGYTDKLIEKIKDANRRLRQR